MEVLDIEQGSEEWFAERLGSIGGSSITAVCAKGQGKMRKNLLYRLAGEILSGEKYEGYSNKYMQDGIAWEPKARQAYEIETGSTVAQVGLVRESEHKHCSPDGLVDEDGIIEIKFTIPSVHIDIVVSNEIPAEYRKQVQWNLSICKRSWVDFVSYCPKIKDRPLLILRRGRDEKLIKEMHEEADKFIIDLASVVRKVKGMS